MTNPASPYLLDRLQARRANPTTRSRRSDIGPKANNLDDDLFLDEATSYANDTLTTTTPINNREPTNVSASLGAREMEKRMDKLSKLNFDLKLELFHCRERMVKLQENCKLLASRADKANKLVEENATLLELNDSLVKELEHRDEAVQEAVTIICDLEEKLERAQDSKRNPYDIPELHIPPRALSVSPFPAAGISSQKSDRSSSTRPSSASPQRRIPSFVGEDKPNTRALRSVYLEPTPTLHMVKSYASLMSHKEDVDKAVSDVDTLDSPRLSVLSESSFPSIYDLPRDEEPGKFDADSNDFTNNALDTMSRHAGSTHDSQSDIHSWIQVHSPQSSTTSSEKGHAQHLRHPTGYRQYPAHLTQLPQTNPKKTPSLKGSSFGGALLPPTPDSASTSVLQDSYMGTSTDTNVPHRVAANLPNAAKHAALLHTPESPSVADMRSLQPKSNRGRLVAGAACPNRHSLSLSSTDEEDEYYEQSDSNTQTRTSTAGSSALYPNGGSIDLGTPSRFQLHRTPGGDHMLQRNGILRCPMERSETTPNLAAMHTPPASLQRSNSTTKSAVAYPQRMERSETTPNLMMNTQASSFQSVNKAQHNVAGGVRAAISQKTHKFLRRMSEHHASSSDHSSKHSRASPSKRTSVSHSSNGSEDSLAVQAANQAVSSKNLVVAHGGIAESKSPSRGLFRRAAGSVRR